MKKNRCRFRRANADAGQRRSRPEPVLEVSGRTCSWSRCGAWIDSAGLRLAPFSRGAGSICRTPLRPAELRPGAGPARLLRLSCPRGCGERSGRGERGPPAPSPPGSRSRCCRGLINGSSRSLSVSLPDPAGANPPLHPCLILQEPPVPGCGCSAVAPPLGAQELRVDPTWHTDTGTRGSQLPETPTPAEGTLPPWAVGEAAGGTSALRDTRGSAAAASRRHLAAAGPCRYRGRCGYRGRYRGGAGRRRTQPCRSARFSEAKCSRTTSSRVSGAGWWRGTPCRDGGFRTAEPRSLPALRDRQLSVMAKVQRTWESRGG